MLVMVVMGGLGTIAGPFVGALVFTLLPEYLRVASEYRLVFFGAIPDRGHHARPARADRVVGARRRARRPARGRRRLTDARRAQRGCVVRRLAALTT
jgi:hypothetical protein